MQALRDSVPEPLRGVLEEAWYLGARTFTLAKNSADTLRILLEPEYESIRGLNVFVSYTTADEPWATGVVNGLKKTGFEVEFFPGSGLPQRQMTDETIRAQLTEALSRSDYICMLFSVASKDRPWVLFEIEEAARRIGRVVLVHNDSVAGMSELALPDFRNDSFSINCVKHSLLRYDETDSKMSWKLAQLLINDHDECITNGLYRPYVTRERNLKRESVMRRYVRARVGALDRYAQRNVVDILPIMMEDLAPMGIKRGQLLEALGWVAMTQGRLNQALHFVDSPEDPWEYEWETFPIPSEFRDWTESNSIEALVIINPNLSTAHSEWNSVEGGPRFGVSKGGQSR